MSTRQPINPPRVRLVELVGALSLATDLGTGVPLEHALRTCLLATRFGEQLGLNQGELHATYYLALLRGYWLLGDSRRPVEFVQ